jgi:hypothetical protein
VRYAFYAGPLEEIQSGQKKGKKIGQVVQASEVSCEEEGGTGRTDLGRLKN